MTAKLLPHYLIIGLGKIGLNVANILAQHSKVTAVSRSAKPTLAKNIHHVQTDARFLTIDDLPSDSHTITHICLIVSPNKTNESSEQGYLDSYFAISQNMVKLAQNLPNLQRVVFISSTSVYGQNHGEVIDIDSEIVLPTSKTAQVLLATEQLLQDNFHDKCTIIRPSGIYGVDRLRLVRMVQDLVNSNIAIPNNTWTNRIFDTDLVTVIVKVLTELQPLPVYLATDFEPASLYNVLIFWVKQQGLRLDLPPDLPMTGKRIISNLPKNWLNYPNYQVGYQAVLNQCNKL